MQAKDSPAMTDFDAGASTENVRHTQWRKLSRKRRRALVRRTLRRLEKEAKRKSVFVGMEDYSHIRSLVFSELPYNPNGHHCSCNCLDDVAVDPELEVNGWNYGKPLRGTGLGHLSGSDVDDVTLSGHSPDSEVMRQSSAQNEREESGSGDPATKGTDEVDNTSLHSAGNQLSNSGERCEDLNIEGGRQTREGCYCEKVISHGNRGRNSIVKQMFQVGAKPRKECSSCQKFSNVITRFRNLSANRRISLAKDDGTLRSRIYALRQKLQHYSNVIERSKFLAVDERVKRKLEVADRVQKAALGLSDRMKVMKVRESYYRNENKEMRERLYSESQEPEGESYAQMGIEKEKNLWSVQEEGDQELKEEDDVANMPSDMADNLSPKKTGWRLTESGLPALIEEDEENLRAVHSSDDRLKTEPKSYDILLINHSDNEVEDRSSAVDDDNSEDADNNEDDNDFAKSWPIYKHVSPKLGSWRHHHVGSEERQKSKADISEQISVIKLVHRLDSGLSFGQAGTEVLQDESLASRVNKVEDEKISNSYLPEEDYNIPLVERQRSFGETIRGVIRQEIYKKGHGSLDESRILESQESQDVLEEEMQRRKSILEESLTEFVDEARKKNEIVEGLLADRDGSTPGVRTSSSENSNDIYDYDDNESESSENARVKHQSAKTPELVDLSTLRTLAQKHQTLKSLRTLDEEMYKVDDGLAKLNKYRMMEAKARSGLQDRETEADDVLPLSKREQEYSIPDPINKKSMIEERIANNNKEIAKIDYNYDLLRDMQFLILNQNTSRAVSYSYFNTAPPYLKTKWQHRIKRGFLRGVKEQKVNEIQLEKVEDVTFKTLNRDEIHKVTLKGKLNGVKSKERRTSTDSSTTSRLSTGRRNSTMLTAKFDKEITSVKLPPLKLSGSGISSPVDTSFDEESESRSELMLANKGSSTLREAFKRLDKRHKFLEKAIMMNDVIKITSNVKDSSAYDGLGFTMNSSRFNTNRSISEIEREERFKSRLRSNRRQSFAAVQNVAVRDPRSGRVSVNSNERRRSSVVPTIQEY